MKAPLFTIRSGGLSAVISALGAEVQNLRTDDGREYNWQGTPPYWTGRGPILFPATGAPWNETYTLQGKEYHMPKHGFAKEETFNVAGQTDDTLTLEYTPPDETRAWFPFDYTLRVRYQVTPGCLRADFEVENRESESLFFQIGGHPALAVPGFDKERAVNGYVRLIADKPAEEELYLIRAREQGCIQPGRFPVATTEDGLVPLCVDTFANEALIFEQGQVQAIELLDLEKRHVATVESDAPCWLVWQMQGVNSPFVCFEPWYGLPDNEGESRELSQRPFVQQAEGGQTWKGGFSVKI